MLSSGLIYRYLRDDEDIDKLLVMFSKLSCTMSKYVNDVVIKKNKERNEIDRLTNACDTFQEKLVIWTLFDTGLRVSGFGDLKTRLSSCLKTHFLRQLY